MRNLTQEQSKAELVKMSPQEMMSLMRLNVLRLKAYKRVEDAEREAKTTDISHRSILPYMRRKSAEIRAFREEVKAEVARARELDTSNALLLQAIEGAEDWLARDKESHAKLDELIQMLADAGLDPEPALDFNMPAGEA